MLQNPGWGDSIACLPGLVPLFFVCCLMRPVAVVGAELSLAAPDLVQFVNIRYCFL